MIAIMTAFKFFCETQDQITNSCYAKLISVDCADLMRMEQDFLRLIDY